MKRIALIIDAWFPYLGGGQKNAYEISRRLVGKNLQIDIITQDSGNANLKLPKNLKVIKIIKSDNPASRLSQIIFMIKAFFYINRRDYDLIHAHAFLPGITARLLMVTKRIPSILTIHGTSLNSNLNNFLLRKIEQFILTEILYSAQISTSRDFLNLNNTNKKVYYIPNGVNLSQFRKGPSTKTANSLLFVGRLHPQKNLENLIKVLPRVLLSYPDASLTIVGDGPERKKLRQLVKNLKLTKNIVFKNELIGDQLARFYKGAKLFVLPSIYEGFPLTLLEAWASGLPVLVTKTGDCAYLINDGVNGFFIKNPDDVEGIGDKITMVLSSKNLDKVAQNGYKVSQKYSWDKAAEQTLEVYQKFQKL